MNSEDWVSFLRARITSLRIAKGVSEYQMSYDLGHSRSYVYHISSGKNLPKITGFFDICEYFDITPEMFFKTDTDTPVITQKVLNGMSQLSERDQNMILGFVERLLEEQQYAEKK